NAYDRDECECLDIRAGIRYMEQNSSRDRVGEDRQKKQRDRKKSACSREADLSDASVRETDAKRGCYQMIRRTMRNPATKPLRDPTVGGHPVNRGVEIPDRPDMVTSMPHL